MKRSLVALIVLALSCVSGARAQQPGTQAVVPNLIRFGGHLVDASGKPYSSTTGVTFALYKDQQGGASLWMETQNVQPDQAGHYTVFLGSMTTNGLPLDLFSDGEARWLGVQVEGKPEQPRVLLVAVPYALKAADAETLGGKPASAFALAAPNAPSGTTSQNGTGTKRSLSGQISQAITGSGTPKYLPMWTSNTNLGISALYQMTNGNVGINTTSPSAKLDVKGGTILEGLLTLSPPGASALKMTGSAFSISNAGIVTFTTGQTFPGAGTITGVTAGTDLTGGGTSGAVTLNVDLTKVPQLLGTNSFTGNQSVTGNVGVTGSISGGAGSFTGQVTEAAGALLPASAPATTTQGYNSQPMDLVASAYNTSAPPSGAPQNQDFQWLAEPVGNNTGSPSGKLDLLFGANGATPTETGLNIASNGQITFAPGQTFPGGGGTVTSVGTGAGLTGGPITSSGTIYVPSGGIINTMLVNSSMTISGVPGSGLTGGGAVALGGSLTSLSVDGSLVPLLNVNDTFSGSITANAFASGSGVQGALAEWTGTTPPYTVGNSPITDSGGTLTSAEPISAPSITTTGSGNAPQVQLGSGTMLVTWTLGTGAPSNSCFVGSLYSRIDGGAGSTLYVCEGPAQPGQGTWTPK